MQHHPSHFYRGLVTGWRALQTHKALEAFSEGEQNKHSVGIVRDVRCVAKQCVHLRSIYNHEAAVSAAPVSCQLQLHPWSYANPLNQ